MKSPRGHNARGPSSASTATGDPMKKVRKLATEPKQTMAFRVLVGAQSGRTGESAGGGQALLRAGQKLFGPTQRLLAVGTLFSAISFESQAECPVYSPTGASKIIGTLGPKPEATLKYRLSCFDDGCGPPAKARVRVQGQTKSAKFFIMATLEKDGVIQETVSLKNGTGITFSKYAEVAQGGGDYTLTLSKVKKNPNDKDSKLAGKMVFQTRQECDIDRSSNYYTGIEVAPLK